jgi:hypothetical protein
MGQVAEVPVWFLQQRRRRRRQRLRDEMKPSV